MAAYLPGCSSSRWRQQWRPRCCHSCTGTYSRFHWYGRNRPPDRSAVYSGRNHTASIRLLLTRSRPGVHTKAARIGSSSLKVGPDRPGTADLRLRTPKTIALRSNHRYTHPHRSEEAYLHKPLCTLFLHNFPYSDHTERQDMVEGR